MSVSVSDLTGIVSLGVGAIAMTGAAATIWRVRAQDRSDIAKAFSDQQETIKDLAAQQKLNVTEIHQLRGNLAEQEVRYGQQLQTVEKSLSQKIMSSEQRTFRILRNLAMTSARYGAIATGQGVLVKLEGLFVFIVEDDEQLADLMRLTLEDAGYRVVVATTLITALTVVRTYPPIPLAIVDLWLDTGSVEEVISLIRLGRAGAQCQVIVYSGDQSLDAAALAKDMGVMRLIVKSGSFMSDKPQLLETLKLAITRYHAMTDQAAVEEEGVNAAFSPAAVVIESLAPSSADGNAPVAEPGRTT